ncbi:MAG: hypothetical protein M3373_14600, partial [Gemmatimonadota bacterium]|nr:hypothetical protein [Gemmatimonadota bacterium]
MLGARPKTAIVGKYEAQTAGPAAATVAGGPRLPGWLAPACAALLLFVHAGISWVTRIPSVTLGHDDAMYVQLARALGEFHYRDLYYVGLPLHVKYPPGYPALLALTSPFGENLDFWIAFGILCSASALALMFDVARKRWTVGVALLFLAAAALNPRVAWYAGRLMTEPPFMLLVALTIWALARDPVTTRLLWLAGAAAIAAGLTRSVGVAVVGGVFLLWLMERRWRPAAILALASVATIGSWMVYTLLTPDDAHGESYLGDTFLYQDPNAETPVQRSVGLRLARRSAHHAIDYVTRLIPAQSPFPT